MKVKVNKETCVQYLKVAGLVGAYSLTGGINLGMALAKFEPGTSWKVKAFARLFFGSTFALESAGYLTCLKKLLEESEDLPSWPIEITRE